MVEELFSSEFRIFSNIKYPFSLKNSFWKESTFSILKYKEKNWANTEIWTRDLFLTKETLYPWAISAIVERETGVEPATFSLEGWRSTNWATPALICGESRIRTCEVKNSRFTVCPRWPLEYLPKKNHYLKEPSRWRDSNPRPADYKSAALASWATSAYAIKKARR